MRTYLKPLLTAIYATLLILSSSLIVGEESRGLYVVGNLSLFSEDVEVRHGDGIGFGAGIGFQFNKLLALELAWDSAPAVESVKLNDYLQAQPIVPNTRRYFDVKTEANRFVSFFGVASLKVSDQLSLVGKVGVARSWRLETVHFRLPQASDVIRTDISEQLYSPVVSAGFRLKLPRFENASIELKTTRFLRDKLKSSFFGASIKFPFPKG